MKRVATQSPRSLVTLREWLAFSIGFEVLTLAWPVCAALESGVYQTPPGATVVEWGDRVTNTTRVLPISATLTVDLSAVPPSVTAQISNAVLEGGDPFALTVRSEYGAQLPDGTYTFRGDYLQEIYPTGTQYGFDWSVSVSTTGQIVWDGIVGWEGGHIWQVTMTNIALLPVARLSIENAGAGFVQIGWATNFADHTLEYASNLSAGDWNAVTNTVATVGSRFSLTFSANEPRRFYRLRKP